MLFSLILSLSGLVLPLDHDLVPPTSGVVVEEPFLVGTASWYDYSLPKYKNGENWSKTHSTCAVRVYERYQTYKVCSDVTGRCIECYHNDYGPARTDRVIDLSSYAFKQLGVPLSRGLTPVHVYII